MISEGLEESQELRGEDIRIMPSGEDKNAGDSSANLSIELHGNLARKPDNADDADDATFSNLTSYLNEQSVLFRENGFACLSLQLAAQRASRSERTKQLTAIRQYLSPRSKPSLEPALCHILSSTDIDVSCPW